MGGGGGGGILCGKGACVCVWRESAWQVGVCSGWHSQAGSMHGRGCAIQDDVNSIGCMVGGARWGGVHVWQ